MGGFAALALRIAFLAGLWLFIVLLAVVIHTDMTPRKAAATGSGAGGSGRRPPRESASRRPASAAADAGAKVLAVDSGPLAGQRFQLVDHVRVGRSADCELLLEDEYVTRKHPHAALDRQADGGWLLTDLGSTNGTYVNGVRITSPKVVTVADVIQIGRTQLRLEA
ncbi:MAG: FHA domain-containing protein [Propionibacteriaceae bacterium]|jgi:hypothetical protein|nr:FHA domain-containing protein [Propionibacteriaceae bacterium]